MLVDVASLFKGDEYHGLSALGIMVLFFLLLKYFILETYSIFSVYVFSSLWAKTLPVTLTTHLYRLLLHFNRLYDALFYHLFALLHLFHLFYLFLLLGLLVLLWLFFVLLMWFVVGWGVGVLGGGGVVMMIGVLVLGGRGGWYFCMSRDVRVLSVCIN